MKGSSKLYFLLLCLISFRLVCYSQVKEDEIRKVLGNRVNSNSNGQNQQTNPNQKTGTPRKDTLGFQHRDDRKDSIAVSYHFLDSLNSRNLDSTINDFDNYFSQPSSYRHLGNNGAAAYSIIFQPNLRPGFDAGFHAFDLYRFRLEETKIYKTNRPYTQLGYQLASGKEQFINIFHTQSPRPNLNFGFDYRLINGPGFFVTQNTNHNSYRLFSHYQGKRKRYALDAVFLGNTIRNAENGGIQNDAYLSDPNKKKRFSVPVNMGGLNNIQPNPFSSKVNTGNIYHDFTFFMRHSYDIGKRDSIIINDSTTEYLFYPKLRFQYSFTYNTQNYIFQDYRADSVFYKTYYDTIFSKSIDSFSLQDKWSILTNDLSLLQFPDTHNPAQFFLLGARVENYTGEFGTVKTHLYNSILHAEYRNKTRNKLWDIQAKGEFYLTGFNNGDYYATASLDRYLNKKLGDIRLFFTNVSRTPAYIFNAVSSFNYHNISLTRKENIISFGAESNNALFRLGFKNHILNNYTYFSNFHNTAQSSKLFNLLEIFASKKFKLNKYWNWYADLVLQQTAGNAPVKVPLLFTRNRIAYEGVFYKKLNLSTGLEMRYNTPYKSYNYSPAMGQFVPQDTFSLHNLPDISAFFHFRIRSFTAFVRAENLNTISFKNGFGFTNNNFGASHYPTQGYIFRLGIKWGFVN